MSQDVYPATAQNHIFVANSPVGGHLLRQYIEAAMHRAKYEILAEDGSYYGDVPGLDGVYASSPTLEECRDELEEVIEEWVLFRVSRGLELPTIDGVELKVRKVS